MEDPLIARETDANPRPLSKQHPVMIPDDPMAASVILWGRCGYVAKSRIDAEARHNAGRSGQVQEAPASKSGS